MRAIEYVLVIFDVWEEDSVDCVVGPFFSTKEAFEWEHRELPRERSYRRTSLQKLMNPTDGYLDATARYERLMKEKP